ncbi:MAG: GNAT family N-acetyltransferase [Planctomycetota bacterium]
MIYEAPRDMQIRHDVNRDVIRSELRSLSEEGQTVLDPMQAERILTVYGIPVCPSKQAATREEAVHLRPIHPEDEILWQELLQGSSDTSIRNRFRSMSQRMSHDQAALYCFIDYDREITLVGEIEHEGKRQLIAAGSLASTSAQQSAEFSVLVINHWQGRGLGGIFLDYCLGIAKAWELSTVVAETAPNNRRMLDVFERRQFDRLASGLNDDSILVSKRV